MKLHLQRSYCDTTERDRGDITVPNVSDNLPTQEELERAPEEAALIMRLNVLTTMRWLAIAGVIITALVASLAFHIIFPTLPVYIVCIVMALYNLALTRQVRRLKQIKSFLSE